MTKAMKLRVHLEYVIFEDLPEGTRLNAREINHLCDTATSEQKRRAFVRALSQSPILLDDERESAATDSACWNTECHIGSSSAHAEHDVTVSEGGENVKCECISCAACGGIGRLRVSLSGKVLLGAAHHDAMDDIECCDGCDGRGISEMCDACHEALEVESADDYVL